MGRGDGWFDGNRGGGLDLKMRGGGKDAVLAGRGNLMLKKYGVLVRIVCQRLGSHKILFLLLSLF